MTENSHPSVSSEVRMQRVRIAIVQAGWHKDIVDEGRRACVETLISQGVPADAIDIFDVPGSFEIPLLVKRLVRAGAYDAVVAAGFVVDGGIYRHEFVADSVIAALMNLQMETEVPIFSMVLTPQQFHEHADHTQFFKRHMQTKGVEAAQTCLTTLTAHRQLEQRRAA